MECVGYICILFFNEDVYGSFNLAVLLGVGVGNVKRSSCCYSSYRYTTCLMIIRLYVHRAPTTHGVCTPTEHLNTGTPNMLDNSPTKNIIDNNNTATEREKI